MPRYFFHLADSSERIVDSDGLELAGDAIAVLEARQAVKEFLEEDEQVASWAGWSLQVTDETGRVLVSLDLVEAELH